MNRYFFRVPEQYRRLVKARIAEIHHQRLVIVTPLLTLLGLIFLVLDTLMIQGEPGAVLPWGYLGLDIAFFLVHGVFFVVLLRSSRTASNTLVYAYMTFILTWAALTGNIQYQRDRDFTAMYLTVLAVSTLGVFSVRGISLLLFVSLSVYGGLNVLWPGPELHGLDTYAGLVALPFIAFGLSRTMYAAVVRNFIANHELERANTELKEARLNLIRQDKLASMGVLSAGIAHEINNPLAFIKSNIAALERNQAHLTGDPAVLQENRAIFEETKEGFRRIGDVVQALGSFARDLPPGVTTPYDLNQGIRTTLVMTRHEVSSDIVCDTDLAELPLVPARGSEVNQVLLNLLMNAFQAVRSLPPAEVRLVLVRTRLEPGYVVAEVSNTGPIIPSELREKIFDPFFSTKGPQSGMGLGLSLSWQIIVNRHGGELELLDRDPVTFRLKLPTAPVVQSATQSTK